MTVSELKSSPPNSPNSDHCYARFELEICSRMKKSDTMKPINTILKFDNIKNKKKNGKTQEMKLTIGSKVKEEPVIVTNQVQQTIALVKVTKLNTTEQPSKDANNDDHPNVQNIKEQPTMEAKMELVKQCNQKKPSKRGRKPKVAKTNTCSKDGKTLKTEQPNRIITDLFPIRRSNRTTTKNLKREYDLTIENCIRTGCQDGLLIKDIKDKGRGIVSTKVFKRGDFVVEYKGDRIGLLEAKRREEVYLSAGKGCYMYYFRLADKSYCIDATSESPFYGRLLNHSRQNPNCRTKSLLFDATPRLVLLAARDIDVDEELTYDYGDHDPSVIKSHPWLAL